MESGPGLVGFFVTTVGIGGLQHRIDVFTDFAESPKGVFDRVEREFYILEGKRFASDGPGWAPLADSTIARKIREGLDMRILRATTELEQSLTSAGANYSVSRTSGDQIVLGTSHPAASAHQDSQRPQLPVRKLIDMDTDGQVIIKAIEEEFMAFVREAL